MWFSLSSIFTPARRILILSRKILTSTHFHIFLFLMPPGICSLQCLYFCTYSRLLGTGPPYIGRWEAYPYFPIGLYPVYLWYTNLEVEFNVHVLSKARGVVIPVGFGIAEGLQQRITVEESIPHAVHLPPMQWGRRHEPQNMFTRFGFTCTRFTCEVRRQVSYVTRNKFNYTNEQMIIKVYHTAGRRDKLNEARWLLGEKKGSGWKNGLLCKVI